MKTKLRACLLLLLTTVIWGFAMAQQREASRFLDPFTFSACRFSMGALAMLPLWRREKKAAKRGFSMRYLVSGCVVGFSLFIASFLQQTGVGGTSAGKTGFLTSLYVVLVPLLGIFLKKKTFFIHWLALIMAMPALYLLCVGENERFVLSLLDLLLLLSALCWAIHILLTDHFAQHIPAVTLCIIEFAVCAVLNWLCAFTMETVRWDNIVSAAIPILYCGVFSTAVGYTVQTIGQKECPPALAALILCLESVFCVIAGALLLGEHMTARGYIGCALMLLAVLIAQGGHLILATKENPHV